MRAWDRGSFPAVIESLFESAISKELCQEEPSISLVASKAKERVLSYETTSNTRSCCICYISDCRFGSPDEPSQGTHLIKETSVSASKWYIFFASVSSNMYSSRASLTPYSTRMLENHPERKHFKPIIPTRITISVMNFYTLDTPPPT